MLSSLYHATQRATLWKSRITPWKVTVRVKTQPREKEKKIISYLRNKSMLADLLNSSRVGEVTAPEGNLSQSLQKNLENWDVDDRLASNVIELRAIELLVTFVGWYKSGKKKLSRGCELSVTTLHKTERAPITLRYRVHI